MPRTLVDLASISVPVGVVFVLAFAALAVARRAGFAVLWVLMIALWVRMLAQTLAFSPPSIPMRFVAWTILALPLYGLGVLGAPSVRRISLLRWEAEPAWLVLAVWLALVASAVYYSDIAPDVLPLPRHVQVIMAVVPFVWGPAPFIISGWEIIRLWNATARLGHGAAAA